MFVIITLTENHIKSVMRGRPMFCAGFPFMAAATGEIRAKGVCCKKDENDAIHNFFCPIIDVSMVRFERPVPP
jgi:hypothetical protein